MSAPNNSPVRAVIADDEDLGRLLLSEAAGQAGLAVDVFDNGTAALAAALAPGVGIVLLDVEMPGMDGFEVCRRLRQVARLDTVPIIMVTGHDDGGAIDRAFQAGATDFITKPVNWALLPHRITYFLRNAAGARTLADREAKVQALLDAVPDALWVFAPDGELRWNPNTRGNPTSATGEATMLARPTMIAPAERMPEVLAAVRLTAQGGNANRVEYRLPDDSGALRSFELRFSRCKPDGVLVVRQDTSERMRAAEHIEKLAYFDTLTSLPNRQQFLEVAERWLRSCGNGDSLAVIYLDLNSFKRINDSFGHSVGDVVLQTVAIKLTDMLRPFLAANHRCMLARVGGDEFVLLVADRTDHALSMAIADAANATLREPIAYNRMEFYATPSVGVAYYPEHATDLDTLLKHADTAMYHAKTTSALSAVIFTAALGSRVRDWLELETRLRRAVREEKLHLHFQPKFWLQDQRIAGVEALIRWTDDEFGEIPAGQLISVAEESGLILDIGAWVVRAVCRQIRSWLDRGVAMPVAINVSGKELLHGDPIPNIEAAIAEFGIPPHLIEIEITESVMVREAAAVSAALQRMRQLGCKVALDDFGTGYSSLAYIAKFPLDRIKIDRAFVRSIDKTAGDAAIANAILSLAQSLELEVTAEGVERSEQLAWLRDRGCHQVQGFLLAKPMSATQLEADFLFRSRSAPESSDQVRERA